MSFDEWWKEKSGWGEAEKLAEYQLAKEAFMAGWSEGYKEAEKDNKDAFSEGMWQERQGDEYGSY